MKKINVNYIFTIIKDILTKACIFFTIMTIILTIIAQFLNMTFNSGTYLMFVFSALGAGAAVQIFRVEKIPKASRHIAFFILLYFDFLLIFIPLSSYTATQSTTLYLSVIFIIAYLVIFGIIAGIKAIMNAVRNKKLKYDKQFENLN